MLSAIFNSLNFSRRRPTDARRAAKPRRLLLESMEDRIVLSSYARIAAASVVEGSGGGTTPMHFQVSLMEPASQEVRIDYKTSDLTATAGQDYVPTSGTLVIPVGQKAAIVTVPVVADDIIEPNEFFRLTLSNPRNAVLVSSVATGTILDDDTPVAPDLAISDVSITRGLNGSRDMTFLVSLNTTLSTPVSVRATTENLTALAGVDYQAKTEVLTFAPGQQTVKFTVKVFGTALHTTTKVFGVRLAEGSVSLRKSLGFGSLRFGA